MSVTIIGDAFVDVICPLSDFSPGETLFEKINIREGGNAFIAIQVSRLGGNVKFIGKLGNDVFGHHFTCLLKNYNVKDLTTKHHHLQTGLCISMTYSNGERTMIADRGANDYLSSDDMMNFIDELVESKIIYFSGYSLINMNLKKVVLNAICRIKRVNDSCIIIFNPGAPNIIKSISDLKTVISEYVDILIMNFDEAKNLTGELYQEDIIKKLEDISKISVITKGNLGCVLSDNGIVTEVGTAIINVKDTTGAGDAFSAGFISALLGQMSLLNSAKVGNETSLLFLKAKS